MIYIYNKSGEIVCKAMAPLDEIALAYPGENTLEYSENVDESLFYVSNNELIARQLKPSNQHTFNFATKQWQDPRTLQDLKDAQWTLIKQAREAALTAPLTTSFGIFDADEKAQASITKSIMLLQTLEALGTPGSVDFTLADNSVVVLTLTQMVEVGLTLGAREQAVRATATARRVQIEAATSQVEVEAVTW